MSLRSSKTVSGLEDETFDALYLADTLELFSRDEMQSVLGECCRVLQDDGRFVVASMHRAGWEDSPFIRGYECVYRNVPGYATVGCRRSTVRTVSWRPGSKSIARN
ncbi:MAG: ubiquinone/menaquinone biosynthesis C-methylase UbiE [Halobacteriales archaeon]|jgi:ubiquinone/menaquinone biosynthesis C-methylase UbiE